MAAAWLFETSLCEGDSLGFHLTFDGAVKRIASMMHGETYQPFKVPDYYRDFLSVEQEREAYFYIGNDDTFGATYARIQRYDAEKVWGAENPITKGTTED